jgi:hypothetical protein
MLSGEQEPALPRLSGRKCVRSRDLFCSDPMGAAVIGLSEGDSIEWCTAADDRHSTTVVLVWSGKTGVLRPARK